MTTSSTDQFIKTALSVSSKHPYNDPNQKSLIRSHIVALINDFPTFEPSSATYFHIDGTSMQLLNVSGLIHVSEFLNDVPLVIWLHKNYPIMAPMVYIMSNSDFRVHENHPFVDKSGVIATTHLNWDEKSSLCTLVHDLVNLFLHDHPSMPSSILKVTVLDDLVTKVRHDFAMIGAQNIYEIEKWSLDQVNLRAKADQVDGYISRLLVERENLEKRVIQLRNYNDQLSEWLASNIGSIMDRYKILTYEDDFECNDMKSKAILDNTAQDGAIEDVMYALDKAVDEGAIEFPEYIKQIRVAAREQFMYRAILLKLHGSLS